MVNGSNLRYILRCFAVFASIIWKILVALSEVKIKKNYAIYSVNFIG